MGPKLQETVGKLTHVTRPPGCANFRHLAVSPSLSLACGYDLRLAPGDLPKIGSNVAYVSFSTVS